MPGHDHARFMIDWLASLLCDYRHTPALKSWVLIGQVLSRLNGVDTDRISQVIGAYEDDSSHLRCFFLARFKR